MADPQQAIATAITNIAQALQQLQQLQAAAAILAAPTAHTAVHTLFDKSTPFDMSLRAGSSAMTEASSELTLKWDGTVDKLPAFLTNLKQRAQMAKWDISTPYGILTFMVNGINHSLLSDFHAISATSIKTARDSRTDPCAIQNSHAIYYYLSKSLEGDLQSTLFEQDRNVEDGPQLFKRMMNMTIAASTQVSLQALQDLQDLDPSSFNYSIPAVNIQATQLFILATTSSRVLSNGEHVQLLITAYNCIKQPSVWSTWVANKTKIFGEGTLVASNGISSHQLLMNAAVLKVTKVNTEKQHGNLNFNWCLTSLEEDVLAMMLTSSKRKTPPTQPGPKDKRGKPADKGKDKLPPFARHFRDGTTGNKYKAGNTKVYEGVTWHYCDYPDHNNRLKWHKFPATECQACKA